MRFGHATDEFLHDARSAGRINSPKTVATPRCTNRQMLRNGQHGLHFVCNALMRYVAGEWVCAPCTQASYWQEKEAA